jgi:hypothetical protein
MLPKLELAGRLFGEARQGWRLDDVRPAGTTTKSVVGATGETDQEILGLVARLERQRLLHHAHFSAFQPVAGTPMEGERPVPNPALSTALEWRKPWKGSCRRQGCKDFRLVP